MIVWRWGRRHGVVEGRRRPPEYFHRTDAWPSRCMAMCRGRGCWWKLRLERAKGERARTCRRRLRLGVVNSGVGNYCVDGNSPWSGCAYVVDGGWPFSLARLPDCSTYRQIGLLSEAAEWPPTTVSVPLTSTMLLSLYCLSFFVLYRLPAAHPQGYPSGNQLWMLRWHRNLALTP